MTAGGVVPNITCTAAVTHRSNRAVARTGSATSHPACVKAKEQCPAASATVVPSAKGASVPVSRITEAPGAVVPFTAVQATLVADAAGED